jgi:transcriptional regulator with XRE-family HTH domain
VDDWETALPRGAQFVAAGKLLHDARWMVGLTQAEVAQRAGVPQQTVALYERGGREPSIATLSRLIAGCGLRLSWRLTPEPGLEDEPTRALLGRAPLDRLDPPMSAGLVRILEANDGLAVVVGGKVGARLHGADIRVPEIELWFDPSVDLDRLTSYLARAGVVYLPPLGGKAERAVADQQVLRRGWPLASRDVAVFLRSAEHFEGLVDRASVMLVPQRECSLVVASPDDCIRWWYDRDLDHLALQRAVRLAPAA